MNIKNCSTQVLHLLMMIGINIIIVAVILIYDMHQYQNFLLEAPVFATASGGRHLNSVRYGPRHEKIYLHS